MSDGPLARLAFRRICHSVSNVGQSVMPPKRKEPDRSPPPDQNSRNSKHPMANTLHTRLQAAQ
ncbi:hypothetical protein PtB15_9B509 [Puccinia triticina]|nr:hypothetical protein PtB15_9B509 [Puccinia triticina]